MIIYTIGHSTHPIEEFITILQAHHISQLVDIRTIPKSRHNPQFNSDELGSELAKHDIKYIYMKSLGGLRPKIKNSINLGWHNDSFRNYADYMQTNEFREALDDLIATSRDQPTTIMCAEAVPWRCHRSLVGDALTIRNVEVRDIMDQKTANQHLLTKFAHVDGLNLTYPTDEPEKAA